MSKATAVFQMIQAERSPKSRSWWEVMELRGEARSYGKTIENEVLWRFYRGFMVVLWDFMGFTFWLH